jgi:putative tryptophan/tyrosine transport system substrate-binding protein
MMHGHEKSSSAIVAVKPVNNTEPPAAERTAVGSTVAESVEPRAEAEGNAGQHCTHRAQYRISVSQTLERIRQAIAVVTRGGNRMRESCKYGSVRGAPGNGRPYRDRREFITLLGGAATWPLAARAQQAAKVYVIGVLSAGAQVRSPNPWSIFVNGLRDLGWIEGKNIVFERRYADNRLDRLAELAAELVRLDVDVIVTIGTLAPLAAKRATTSIPIVMINAGDPVGSGLVASLARPGGNVTGMSLMAPDLGGKRLELLKETLTRLSHVAVIWNAANPYSALVFDETQSAAKKLTVEIQSLEVRDPGDFDGALATMLRNRVDALVIVEDPLTFNHLNKIAEFCANKRLAAIYGLREFADAGGLMTYGASQADLFRRSVDFVDKVLRGFRPSDLPVQQPTKFELVINLKTAKAVGLTVPDTLLARADEVIE